jgi:altronate dehydratase
MENIVLVIHEKDNVAVALEEIPRDTEIILPDGRKLRAANDIPYCHKVALADLREGDAIIKYGETIGRAAGNIDAGAWVHTHNLKPLEDS